MSTVESTTAILSVPDISCAHCARAIESALMPLEGVRDVTVDIEGKSVRVRYDADQEIVSRFGDVLAEEGYPVASIDLRPAADRR